MAAALALVVPILPSVSVAGQGSDKATPPESEIVGLFYAGGPITGAALEDGYLYLTTADKLSIYDVSAPMTPRLVSSKTSPHYIYGELISTDGDILLLNDGLAGRTLDVWNIEDKSNPMIQSSVEGIGDEHVSCLLDCRWAYGSGGTIVDLRDPGRPVQRDEDWRKIAGLPPRHVHRLDEYRHGYMATAPRGEAPVVLDVRRPLHPRVIARTKVPLRTPNAFLYSEWVRTGRDRFMIASTERRRCDSQHQGALITFDTKGWPQDRRFELAGTFKYRGRTDDEACAAYYFSLHPEFADGGLVLLPNGLEGTRIVNVDRNGTMEEVDSFIPPISDVWLAFWVDEEIFYALNTTGEVYILRYT